MSEFRVVQSLEEAGEFVGDRKVYLAIGFFDGVHRGHRKVIGKAIEDAKKEEGLAAVLTFFPHPSEILGVSGSVKMITSQSKKYELLKELGVELVIEQAFTKEYAKTEAEDFLPSILKEIEFLSGLYVGENFRFGSKRRGDVTLLKEQGDELGVTVFVQDGVMSGGEVISSSRIRKLLSEGREDEARELS